MKIIGRKNEVELLNNIYYSNQPSFVALFGRRRVGKTFLIDELFASRFTFKHTALSIIDDDTSNVINTFDQLNHFKESLYRYGYRGKRVINDWFQAFYALEDLLDSKDNARKLIFIDELPWLDTRGSKFINAFEAFWNSWCNDHNVMLVIAGSANAWMTKKMLNNYGGLYDRITHEIELEPFTLHECEEYFKEKNIIISRYDIVQAYMVFGGIPYYLDKLNPNLSLIQNIDTLFFKKKAPLRNEFVKLFKSTFKNPELIIKIVKILFTKSIGYSRSDILTKLNMEDGETLSNAFNALSSSGFVMKYRPLTTNRKELYYKLIDPFCLFYLHFINEENNYDENMFERNYESRKISSWRGLSFENVCFNHIKQIKNKLMITVIASEVYPLIYVKEGKISSQIDLVIDRKDNIANLCEAKFYSDEYLLDKDDYYALLRKDKDLSLHLNKKTVIHNTLITTFGLRQNEYSSLYQKIVTLDDLFTE